MDLLESNLWFGGSLFQIVPHRATACVAQMVVVLSEQSWIVVRVDVRDVDLCILLDSKLNTVLGFDLDEKAFEVGEALDLPLFNVQVVAR